MIQSEENLLNITDKLKYVKHNTINEQSFYFYLWNGMQRQNLFPYTSYENGKMTGCMVLSLSKDLKSSILTLIFIWIDKNYPKLWLEYLEFAENEAKRLGVDRIAINTRRDREKVILRKLEKFGYKSKYIVIEKEIKEVR